MHAHEIINNVFLLYDCQLLIIWFNPHHGGPLCQQDRRELRKTQYPTDRRGANICHTSQNARAPELERGVHLHQPRLQHPRPILPHPLPHTICNPLDHRSRPPSQSRHNSHHTGRHNRPRSSAHPICARRGNACFQHLIQRRPRSAPATYRRRWRNVPTSQAQAAPRV